MLGTVVRGVIVVGVRNCQLLWYMVYEGMGLRGTEIRVVKILFTDRFI